MKKTRKSDFPRRRFDWVPFQTTSSEKVSVHQNDCLAEALGVLPAFDKLLEIPGCRLVSNEPAIQFALDDDCRTQCRISIETRTSAYHIRTGEFPEEQLSVYLTMRRYGSLDSNTSFVDTLNLLQNHGVQILDGFVVESMLKPLQETIAIR